MGRPLKIAKAQAVLTITDTAETGSIITVSQSLTTLGVIAGMPFVVASTVGGLTANTTYWVLTVIDANNFTASATDLSANTTRTPAPLTDTTGQSVSASVGVVDAYFNNPDGGAGFPATNANTYSVVGGNTAIIGPQVLPRVAIGVNGTGTIYGDTGNTNIYGSGTDLANTLSVGSAVQVLQPTGVPGQTNPVNIGFVTTLTGYITVAVANTNATGNVIRTSGNAQTLFVGAPVVFDANTGGLVAGATYFVDAIANASAFTVSTSQYGPQKAVTTGTDTANATIDVAVLSANALANFAGTSFVYANDEAGFILRQKGKQKYLVQGGTTGLVAQCYTANLANTALTPNTMNILATDAASGTAYVQSLSDFGSLEFTANSGPVATGNIVLADADPVGATFNTAYAANTYGGQPYPIVTISNA